MHAMWNVENEVANLRVPICEGAWSRVRDHRNLSWNSCFKSQKNPVWIYLSVTSLSNLSDKLPGCTVDQGVYNDITREALVFNSLETYMFAQRYIIYWTILIRPLMLNI